MEVSKSNETDKSIETFIANVLQTNILKFIEELFRYLLQETEGLESTPFFKDVKHVLPSYEKKVGIAIQQMLTVTGVDIDHFFEKIKEKIQVRENLKIFISGLGDKFLSVSSQHELHFLTITSRIFALMLRADILSPNVFIEYVAGTVLEHVSKSLYSLAETKSLPALNIESSIADILKNSSWIDECRGLRCGEVSDYFSS